MEHVAILHQEKPEELRDGLPLQGQMEDKAHDHLGKDHLQGLEADVANKGAPQAHRCRMEETGGLAEVHRSLEAGQ